MNTDTATPTSPLEPDATSQSTQEAGTGILDSAPSPERTKPDTTSTTLQSSSIETGLSTDALTSSSNTVQTEIASSATAVIPSPSRVGSKRKRPEDEEEDQPTIDGSPTSDLLTTSASTSFPASSTVTAPPTSSAGNVCPIPPKKARPDSPPVTTLPVGTPSSGPATAGNDQSPDANRTTLWIGDLEKWEDEEVVFHFFSRLAPKGVVSVKIARDREEQRSLGYGFIDFASREIAERILTSAPAIKRPHGRRFKLTWAKGKTRRPFNPTTNGLSPPPGPTGGPPLALRSSHTPMETTTNGSFSSSNAEWFVKLVECTACCDAQRLCDEVLRTTGFAPGISHVNTYTIGSKSEATIYFKSSEWFFSFLQYFSDGKVHMGAFSGYIEIPPVVMTRWTRLYESSACT